MAEIILEGADNGVIKTIIDNNINGAGEVLERKSVYDFSNDKLHHRKVRFLIDLIEDLGIETGNVYDEHVVHLSIDWGGNYKPTKEQINNKINKLKAIIKLLESQKEAPVQKQKKSV